MAEPDDDVKPDKQRLKAAHAAIGASDDEAAERATLASRAAAVDANPALVRAVERLRRRLPGDSEFGDPLSTAGRAPVEAIARELTARGVDRPSALGQVGLGALQLWQSLSESAGRGRGDRELAILFTDLAGYSSWALRVGDAAAVAMLRQTGSLLEVAVAGHGGRTVKRLGDGLMAVFLHPADAVGAALDAAEELAAVDIDGYVPRLRAGVHWGRPRKLGGDYLGVDVNIAARIGDEARADQLLVSEAAVGLLDASALDVGRPKKLKAKGAPPGMRVQRVARAQGWERMWPL